ncbi:hypothetical protein KBX63_31090 [Micromonospora sp. U21]|nr:hypothetical protein [Micromonospora sp. U21]
MRVLPIHACATAAQHHVYQVREPGRRTVRTVWPRLRGW